MKEVRGDRGKGPPTRRRAQVAEEEGSSISGVCLLRGSLGADRSGVHSDRRRTSLSTYGLGVVEANRMAAGRLSLSSVLVCAAGYRSSRCLRSLDWA